MARLRARTGRPRASRCNGAAEVVHVLGNLRRGGSEGQAIQLVRLLHQQGAFRVTLACLSRDGPLRQELDGAGAEILEYPLTSLRDLNAVRQLRRFVTDLRERDVGIVQTHDLYSNLFGIPAARLGGVPVCIAARRNIGGVGMPGRRRLERVLYQLADRVVANSEAVRRDLVAHGVPESKIVTIRNAVDRERVSPRLTRGEALTLFGLPSHRRFIVMVANLSYDVKDHPTFLRAAVRIKRAEPASAFVVAGGGTLLPRMVQVSRSLGIADDVFFIGPCDAVGDLLAVSEVGVLTSTAEGLPNAVLEYMAAGRPVVATDVGGVREAVVDGETGYLVKAGDDAAVARRVVALLEDPGAARRMGERARQHTDEQFSCALLVRRTIDLYEAALDGRAP
jgi:L-malate glycosyltransferase